MAVKDNITLKGLAKEGKRMCVYVGRTWEGGSLGNVNGKVLW